MDKQIVKKYKSDKLTVVWQPDLCIHSRNCFNGLPKVFNPSNRPWITPENEDDEVIRAQIDKCPSGALSYILHDGETSSGDPASAYRVEVLPNGPLMVHGNLSIKQSDGTEIEKNNVTAFCRCGSSSSKPFCDGSHRKIDFQG
jgi:uncharacterized Fe-S cluster protein YjdI